MWGSRVVEGKRVSLASAAGAYPVGLCEVWDQRDEEAYLSLHNMQFGYDLSKLKLMSLFLSLDIVRVCNMAIVETQSNKKSLSP